MKTSGRPTPSSRLNRARLLPLLSCSAALVALLPGSAALWAQASAPATSKPIQPAAVPVAIKVALAPASDEGKHQESDRVREYLQKCALLAKGAETFRDPSRIVGTKFDPELAYLPADCVGADGVDGSRVLYTHEGDGARKIVNCRSVPCRINTYGDSMTECDQVSDGETWQEVLAAHIGEPVRNYGVGGYGAYQAFLRMKRVESGPGGAPYVILNIFEDDHYRNLMACRWLHIPYFQAAHRDNPGFHAMPWAHIRFDVRTQSWIECANPFTTPESLCRLGDPVFVYETFCNDTILKLDLGVHDRELEQLAEHFQVDASQLYTTYALASTEYIVSKAKEYLDARGKKLMIVLSYGSGTVEHVLGGGARFDRTFVDHLSRMGCRSLTCWQNMQLTLRSFGSAQRNIVAAILLVITARLEISSAHSQ